MGSFFYFGIKTYAIYIPYLCIYNSPVFSLTEEPGCLVKGKTNPKNRPFGRFYLTINNLILFKPSKTMLKFVKKC
jgi:hypothetical protein